MEVGLVAEVEGVGFAVGGDAPVSGDVGYHVHVLVEANEATEEGVERACDRAGVQGGIEGIRLFVQEDEYVVGRGLRRVGREECEGGDDLVQSVAQAVEVRDGSERSNHEALASAEHTCPGLLDSNFAVPHEHGAESGGARPEGYGRLFVNFDEAFAVVRYLPVHPLARGVGAGVTVNGYLDGYEVGVSRRVDLDDGEPTAGFANPPVGGRGDRKANELVGVGLGVVGDGYMGR